MRILVTNDDGVHEAGLAALCEAAAPFGEITVVAPVRHQSAASHAITLGDLSVGRVRVERAESFDAIAVGGTPADCVRLAILELLAKPPELVLSGINAGANVGVHVFYSGTVAAAAEAAMLGVPAAAFSLALDDGPVDFRGAIDTCRRVLERLIAIGPKRGDLINVNIPARRKPRGVRVVAQSIARLKDRYRLQADLADQTYRLSCGGFASADRSTDVSALGRGYVTITPLQPDMTDQAELRRLADCQWNTLLG